MTDAENTDEGSQNAAVSSEATPVAVDRYSKEELNDLSRALGQVVLGAGMSEKSGAFGLMREIVAAMQASAIFVGESSNPLLKQIVTDTDPSAVENGKETDESAQTAQQAVDEGIEAAKRTHALLLAKGHDDDADAWAQLLLTAANAAVQATKTGGFLGFGGEKITPSEQAYMQRLADTLGYKKA